MINFNQLERLNNCLVDWNVNYSVYPYNGYTVNEVLCQFFDAINKGIITINEYTNLITGVLNWIKEEGLKEEVEKELDKWLQDGTLENIINQKLLGDILEQISDLEDVDKNLKEGLKGLLNNFEEFKKENEKNLLDIKKELKEQRNFMENITFVCYSKEGIGACVNKAIADGYRTIKIAPGEYMLDEPIILKDNLELYGSKNTIITNSLDAPAIKTSGIFNEFVSNCYIHDLHLIKAKATQYWHLDLCNLNMSKVERVRCEMADVYPMDVVGGLYVYYNGEYVGEEGAYSLNMEKLDFRSCSVKIGITDCYLSNSNIWGKNRKYALWIASSSQQISNCQFVGGAWAGGIYIKNESNYDVEIIKISNCYFDGSYPGLDTYAGIYAEKLRSSTITGNTFWRQKDCGLILVDAKANTITGNTFEDNGIKNLKQGEQNVPGGLYDIKFTGIMESNVVSNNTFASYDNFYIKPKAIDVSAVSSWNNNVLTNNIIFNNGHYDSSPFNGFTSLGSNTLQTNGCYGSWLENHDGTSS